MANSRIFAVVLAAGESSRFGGSKQLQEYRNAPLVRRAMRLAEAASGEHSILVTGHDWRAVFDACKPLRGFLVHNSGYRSGMAGSIASGVRSVSRAADAILLLLADQPLITTQHLETLIGEWNGSAENIVATSFAGTTGPPILFPARYFGQLASLQGDRGARSILADAGERMREVAFEPAATDIDRPEDLDGLP